MKRRAGFTLIEFITWFGLAGVTFAAVLSFESFARRTSFESTARIQALQHHERLVRRFENDANRATGFRIVANRGIILEVPALGPDGRPIEGVVNTIVYAPKYDEGGALIRSVDPGEGSAAKKSSGMFARYLRRVTFSELEDKRYTYPIMQTLLEFSVPVHKASNLDRTFSFCTRFENCSRGGGK